MSEFLNLSDEILLNILALLSPKELVRVRQTCPRLHSLSTDEGIWENLLIRDYNFRKEDFWLGWNAEEIYKIAHTHRELLGFWHCEFSYFGLFVQITLDRDGIVANDCAPPLDDSVLDATGIGDCIIFDHEIEYDDVQRLHRFRYRPLFALVPETSATDVPRHDHLLRLVCYHSALGPHSSQENDHKLCLCMESQASNSLESTCFAKTSNGFVFTCRNRTKHGSLELQHWLEWEHGFRLRSNDRTRLDDVLSILREQKDYELRLEKFETKASLFAFSLSRRYAHSLPPFGPPKMRQLTPFTSPLSPTISPGFYFCHFNNWHGWELLKIYFVENGTTLIAEKATGDQMIPVERTCFRVDLNQNIGHLTYADFATMASLRSAMKRTAIATGQNAVQNNSSRTANLSTGSINPAINGHASAEEPTVSHPFRVPSDCEILGSKSVPDQCDSYFTAEGQIAFPNFTNPRYLACIFMVFNQDQLGLLWLDLKCFMPIYKVRGLS